MSFVYSDSAMNIKFIKEDPQLVYVRKCVIVNVRVKPYL